MIGTDENRAALHVEVIFWSGKRKIPPSLVSMGHTIRASSVPNQGTEIRIGLGQKKTLPE